MPPHLESSPRRGEEIIRIPLSLEGEGQGEGEIEAYPAAHSVKSACNQFCAPINNTIFIRLRLIRIRE